MPTQEPGPPQRPVVVAPARRAHRGAAVPPVAGDVVALPVGGPGLVPGAAPA